MIRTTGSRRTVRASARAAAVPVIVALLVGIPAAVAQAQSGSTRAQSGSTRAGSALSAEVFAATGPGSRSAASASTTTKRKVKFYVVRTSFQGEPEFLFEIAERFLGSGDRSQEIFQLNVGRQQPDGDKLVRAETVKPGWQLILPDDAQGNGLQVGEVTVTQSTQEADPTTAATTPAASSPAAADSAAADSDSPFPVLWIAGGVALLLGLVLIAYALQIRRNALRLAASVPPPSPHRAGPGRAPSPEPAPPASGAAWRLGRGRAASDPLPRPFDAAAAWTVDRALRSLAGLVAAEHRSLPSFYAVSLDSERLRLRLAVPDHEPPDPWNADEDGLGWSASLRALQAVPLNEQIPAPSPRLVTLGMDGGTRVLIDLGQATGVISVEGQPAGTRALLQGWIAELAAGPWADQVKVIVAALGTGPDPAELDPAEPGRVQHVEGVREALAAVGSVGWAGGGAVAGVLRGGAAGSDGPGVLVLGSAARGNELEQIQALAGRPDAGWAVVFAGRVPAARWRFTLSSDGKLDTGVLGITVQATDRNAAIVSPGR